MELNLQIDDLPVYFFANFFSRLAKSNHSPIFDCQARRIGININVTKP